MGLYRTTPDGQILDANPAIIEMMGYPDRETYLRLNAADLYGDAGDRSRWRSLMERDGIVRAFEAPVRRHDGTVIWVRDNARAVRDTRGGGLCYEGTWEDVTARRQAEEALRQSERVATLNSTISGILATAGDSDIHSRVLDVILEAFQSPVGLFGYVSDDGALVCPAMTEGVRSQCALAAEDVPLMSEVLSGACARILREGVSVCQNRKHRLPTGHVPISRSLGAPVIYHGSTIGLIHIANREWDYGEDDCRLLERIAEIIAPALNARLERLRGHRERDEAHRELTRLNQALRGEQREVRALNRALERRVKERTRDLGAANKELRKRNRQLTHARAQAITDSLTGLHNHRAFHERARDEVSRAGVDGTEIGLIMMDIDGFKSVNDALGHLEGDRILRRLARTLARAVPQHDAYRYGGDEFAVLLPGLTHSQVTTAAERLRRAIERPVNGSGIKLTVSLGVASFPSMATSAEELVYGADAAMYWAKSAGKNRVGDWSRLVRFRAEGVLPWYAADRAIRAPDSVSALVAALAAKDPATSAHTERCSWYAARLAEELGLDERDTSIVRLSSLLHDIGKLAVPDEILFKPGPLDEREWDHMRRHPTTALHILSQIRSVADATPAILHHHEHFDGSGYPDGLAGQAIPIASRILLVTDAFDAMTTDRPYRRAMPIDTALAELKRGSGGQFDPEIVAAFLRILRRHGAHPVTRSRSGQPPRKAVKSAPAAT